MSEAEKYHGKFYVPKNGKAKVWPGFKAFLSSRLKLAGKKGMLVSELVQGLKDNYTGTLSLKEAEELLSLRLRHRKFELQERQEGVYAIYRNSTH